MYNTVFIIYRCIQDQKCSNYLSESDALNLVNRNENGLIIPSLRLLEGLNSNVLFSVFNLILKS